MGIPIFTEFAGTDFQNSEVKSEDARNKIIEQEQAGSRQHDEKIKENENNIRNSKQDYVMICPMNTDG